MTTRALTPLLLLLPLFSACGGSSGPPAPPPVAGKSVDAATAGSVSGKVTFTGARPAPEVVKMDSDPACVDGSGPNPQSDAVLISNDGALQNVFVYVKEGLDPAYAFPVPGEPVVLDQHGCHYRPRVLGVRVGQPIAISNSDPTFHNVHALPNTNQEFNQGLPTQGTQLTRTFTAPEVMVRFKCDVHGWMAAHVGVLAHPYFAVTGADGAFTLKGLPPGTYTVEAWHERFGTKTSQVMVAPSSTGTADFAFAGS